MPNLPHRRKKEKEMPQFGFYTHRSLPFWPNNIYNHGRGSYCSSAWLHSSSRLGRSYYKYRPLTTETRDLLHSSKTRFTNKRERHHKLHRAKCLETEPKIKQENLKLLAQPENSENPENNLKDNFENFKQYVAENTKCSDNKLKISHENSKQLVNVENMKLSDNESRTKGEALKQLVDPENMKCLGKDSKTKYESFRQIVDCENSENAIMMKDNKFAGCQDEDLREKRAESFIDLEDRSEHKTVQESTSELCSSIEKAIAQTLWTELAGFTSNQNVVEDFKSSKHISKESCIFNESFENSDILKYIGRNVEGNVFDAFMDSSYQNVCDAVHGKFEEDFIEENDKDTNSQILQPVMVLQRLNDDIGLHYQDESKSDSENIDFDMERKTGKLEKSGNSLELTLDPSLSTSPEKKLLEVDPKVVCVSNVLKKSYNSVMKKCNSRKKKKKIKLMPYHPVNKFKKIFPFQKKTHKRRHLINNFSVKQRTSMLMKLKEQLNFYRQHAHDAKKLLQTNSKHTINKDKAACEDKNLEFEKQAMSNHVLVKDHSKIDSSKGIAFDNEPATKLLQSCVTMNNLMLNKNDTDLMNNYDVYKENVDVKYNRKNEVNDLYGTSHLTTENEYTGEFSNSLLDVSLNFQGDRKQTIKKSLFATSATLAKDMLGSSKLTPNDDTLLDDGSAPDKALKNKFNSLTANKHHFLQTNCEDEIHHSKTKSENSDFGLWSFQELASWNVSDGNFKNMIGFEDFSFNDSDIKIEIKNSSQFLDQNDQNSQSTLCMSSDEDTFSASEDYMLTKKLSSPPLSLFNLSKNNDNINYELESQTSKKNNQETVQNLDCEQLDDSKIEEKCSESKHDSIEVLSNTELKEDNDFVESHECKYEAELEKELLDMDRKLSDNSGDAKQSKKKTAPLNKRLNNIIIVLKKDLYNKRLNYLSSSVVTKNLNNLDTENANDVWKVDVQTSCSGISDNKHPSTKKKRTTARKRKILNKQKRGSRHKMYQGNSHFTLEKKGQVHCSNKTKQFRRHKKELLRKMIMTRSRSKSLEKELGIETFKFAKILQETEDVNNLQAPHISVTDLAKISECRKVQNKSLKTHPRKKKKKKSPKIKSDKTLEVISKPGDKNVNSAKVPSRNKKIRKSRKKYRRKKRETSDIVVDDMYSTSDMKEDDVEEPYCNLYINLKATSDNDKEDVVSPGLSNSRQPLVCVTGSERTGGFFSYNYDGLPTILPPKRRRMQQKRAAFQESAMDAPAERFIREFPRYNWLENKINQLQRGAGLVTEGNLAAANKAGSEESEALNHCEMKQNELQISQVFSVSESECGMENFEPTSQSNIKACLEKLCDEKSGICSSNSSSENVTEIEHLLNSDLQGSHVKMSDEKSKKVGGSRCSERPQPDEGCFDSNFNEINLSNESKTNEERSIYSKESMSTGINLNTEGKWQPICEITVADGNIVQALDLCVRKNYEHETSREKRSPPVLRVQPQVKHACIDGKSSKNFTCATYKVMNMADVTERREVKSNAYIEVSSNLTTMPSFTTNNQKEEGMPSAKGENASAVNLNVSNSTKRATSSETLLTDGAICLNKELIENSLIPQTNLLSHNMPYVQLDSYLKKSEPSTSMTIKSSNEDPISNRILKLGCASEKEKLSEELRELDELAAFKEEERKQLLAIRQSKVEKLHAMELCNFFISKSPVETSECTDLQENISLIPPINFPIDVPRALNNNNDEILPNLKIKLDASGLSSFQTFSAIKHMYTQSHGRAQTMVTSSVQTPMMATFFQNHSQQQTKCSDSPVSGKLGMHMSAEEEQISKVPPPAHQHTDVTHFHEMIKIPVPSGPQHLFRSCPYTASKYAIKGSPLENRSCVPVTSIPYAHSQLPFEAPGNLIVPLIQGSGLQSSLHASPKGKPAVTVHISQASVIIPSNDLSPLHSAADHRNPTSGHFIPPTTFSSTYEDLHKNTNSGQCKPQMNAYHGKITNLDQQSSNDFPRSSHHYTKNMSQLYEKAAVHHQVSSHPLISQHSPTQFSSPISETHFQHRASHWYKKPAKIQSAIESSLTSFRDERDLNKKEQRKEYKQNEIIVDLTTDLDSQCKKLKTKKSFTSGFFDELCASQYVSYENMPRYTSSTGKQRGFSEERSKIRRESEQESLIQKELNLALERRLQNENIFRHSESVQRSTVPEKRFISKPEMSIQHSLPLCVEPKILLESDAEERESTIINTQRRNLISHGSPTKGPIQRGVYTNSDQLPLSTENFHVITEPYYKGVSVTGVNSAIEHMEKELAFKNRKAEKKVNHIFKPTPSLAHPSQQHLVEYSTVRDLLVSSNTSPQTAFGSPIYSQTKRSTKEHSSNIAPNYSNQVQYNQMLLPQASDMLHPEKTSTLYHNDFSHATKERMTSQQIVPSRSKWNTTQQAMTRIVRPVSTLLSSPQDSYNSQPCPRVYPHSHQSKDTVVFYPNYPWYLHHQQQPSVIPFLGSPMPRFPQVSSPNIRMTSPRASNIQTMPISSPPSSQQPSLEYNLNFHQECLR